MWGPWGGGCKLSQTTQYLVKSARCFNKTNIPVWQCPSHDKDLKFQFNFFSINKFLIKNRDTAKPLLPPIDYSPLDITKEYYTPS